MKNIFNKLAKKKAQKQNSEYEEMMDRLVPIAKEIVKIIGGADLPIGQIMNKDGVLFTDEDAKYSAVGREILELLLEKNIRYSEKDIVFQIALQAFEKTQQKTLSSLEKSLDRASKTLWEKDFMDVTMEDMDVIIKSGAKVVTE